MCQQPACERHCLAEVHHWQMSKSPPSLSPSLTPLPPLLPLSLPGLSSSFVSEHREHRGPLRRPLEKTYGLCSSFIRFQLTNTTVFVVGVKSTRFIVAFSRSCITTACAVGARTPAAFHVVTTRDVYLHARRKLRSHDRMQMWPDFHWTTALSLAGLLCWEGPAALQ